MMGQGSGRILTEGNLDLPLRATEGGAFRLRGGNEPGRVFLTKLLEVRVGLRL
jgi:hypothetical protein